MGKCRATCRTSRCTWHGGTQTSRYVAGHCRCAWALVAHDLQRVVLQLAQRPAEEQVHCWASVDGAGSCCIFVVQQATAGGPTTVP